MPFRSRVWGRLGLLRTSTGVQFNASSAGGSMTINLRPSRSKQVTPLFIDSVGARRTGGLLAYGPFFRVTLIEAVPLVLGGRREAGEGGGGVFGWRGR